MQTVISIIGLAVGFTCFSLATLWMRYENTYDGFHKNAKNLYVAIMPESFENAGITTQFHPAVALILKETFPEVKEATNISWNMKTSIPTSEDDRYEGVTRIMVHPDFMTMFNIKVLEGSLDFTDNTKVAITKEKAQIAYGDESPIGRKLWGETSVVAVIDGYANHHSNHPFDILGLVPNSYFPGTCVLELLPNVNVEAFKQKLYEHKVSYEWIPGHQQEITNISLIPLTDFRTKDPTMKREIKFQHIKLFAWSGILVILCALFNYLTLFVSRFKIRGKELALRIVCGASLWSLFSLLLVEFLITLLTAVLLGLIIMNFISPEFQKLSEIQMNMSGIYVELGLYILFLILLTILLFAFTLAVFRKFALNTTIRSRNNKLFRKISIVSQLIISIGFVFCTAIMIKQVSYLHNSTDIGFEYKNRSAIYINSRIYTTSEDGRTQVTDSEQITDIADALCDKMKQIPEITEVIKGFTPLMPVGSRSKTRTTLEDGKEVEIRNATISKAFADFYGLQLVVGEMITEENTQGNIWINESALKFFGWHKDETIGKKAGGKTVKGVLRNIYNGLPTVEVTPFIYDSDNFFPGGQDVIFKYTNRSIAEKKIRELIKNDFPDISNNRQLWSGQFSDAEEAYEEFFKSEKALIMMLNIMSAICVLISIFGFFSLVSLSCEEKRKEIAIRKVNGADIHDIIAIFFKEYSLLLAIGAAIAFPLGYYIMKNWLDQYMNKTSIDLWIYAAILLAFATIIVICVGWRVYKTSRENPADVVKSE